ncbi:hypothetical protein [Lamprocystis purpurea]|jgi:hypothetical protein|uniref:hypothetical protein n=1 Tax=Lamprocystis purpurea TaxID=61598 RepID=UPI000362E4B3|nr:hypothetical protein [Lamprocystis purpurea]
MIHQPLEPNTEREPILQGRRRLLQAAAAAAPLIATLPNGAAAATASTAQCILASRAASPDDVIPGPALDTFVRQHGTMTIFHLDEDTETKETVYSIAAAPRPGTYYKSDGTAFDTTGWTKDSESDVLLLRVFQPISDTFDSVGNPTSVADCGSTSILPQCIFPVTQQDPGSGNMGITASCLCSVNPSLVAGACGAP